MSCKQQSPDSEKVISQKQTRQLAVQHPKTPKQQQHPAAIPQHSRLAKAPSPQDVLQLQRTIGNRAAGQMNATINKPTAQHSSDIRPSQQVIQRDEKYTNTAAQRTFNVTDDGKNIIAQEIDGKQRGSVKYEIENDHMLLLQIESHPEKGSGLGGLLTYLLALTTQKQGLKSIKIPSATPDERGFYERMGFLHDEAAVKRWIDTTELSREKVLTQYGHLINLEGTTENVLTRASSSFNKRWKQE